MAQYILKAYYGDLFFEFMLQDKKADFICFLPGFPSSNNYDSLMRFLHQNGFHVFTIRYRGSYQSRGKFLEKNVVEDLKEFLKHVKKGKVTSLWDLKEFRFQVHKKYLFARSVGGAVACGLAAITNFFDKMVLFAPVWDFSKHNKQYPEQDIQHLTTFVKRGFQNCYRIEFDDLEEETVKIKEMRPEQYLPKLKLPILVFHAANDNTVSIKHTLAMMKKKANIQLVKHELGHGPKTELLEKYEKEFDRFMK